MKTKTYHLTLMLMISIISAKEVNLPLCPTNIQYFPQNLPLHCKMPPNAKVVKLSGLPSGEPSSIPLPGFSPGLPMIPTPVLDSMSVLGPYPRPTGVHGLFPGAMPMPLPAGPSAKLPVIVMPFYSPDLAFKKPKPSRLGSGTDTDTSFDTDTSISSDMSSSSKTSSERGICKNNKNRWKKGWKRRYKKNFTRNTRRFNRQLRAKRKHQKNDQLTPILQYVTKEGYVIYEKKISKGEAKGWLNGQNIADENINEYNGMATKHVQLRILTKGNDENVEMNHIQNNKNKHKTNVELDDDKKNNYESLRRGKTKNIKAQRNNKNNKEDRNGYLSEEFLEYDKSQGDIEKRGKAEDSTKRTIRKFQRRRQKSS